jgi:hypothetical protein
MEMTVTAEQEQEREFARAMRGFISSRRSQGYFLVVNILFALALGLMVSWLQGLLKEALPLTQPTLQIVRLSGRFHATEMSAKLPGSNKPWTASDVTLKLPAVQSSPGSVSKSLDDNTLAVTVSGSQTDRAVVGMSLLLRWGLFILVFYLMLLLWTYFSHVLVYHTETPSGEVYTFGLGIVVLLVIGTMSFHPEWWGFGLAVVLYTISMKNFRLYTDAIDASTRNLGIAVPAEPYSLRRWVLGWLRGFWPYLMPIWPNCGPVKWWGQKISLRRNELESPVDEPHPVVRHAYRWYARHFLYATGAAIGAFLMQIIPGGALRYMLDWLNSQSFAHMSGNRVVSTFALNGFYLMLAALGMLVLLIILLGRLFLNAYARTVDIIVQDANNYARRFYNRNGFIPYE